MVAERRNVGKAVLFLKVGGPIELRGNTER